MIGNGFAFFANLFYFLVDLCWYFFTVCVGSYFVFLVCPTTKAFPKT